MFSLKRIHTLWKVRVFLWNIGETEREREVIESKVECIRIYVRERGRERKKIIMKKKLNERKLITSVA